MKDKVVIVTGASSGIGRALAEVFSAAGAKVVLAARNQDKLEAIASLLPHEKLVVCTDVSKEEDCQNLVEQTIQKFGQIDILINNAGISMRALFRDVDLEVLHKLMDVNFWGAVYCTKYALPHILAQKGSIVGVSSIAGYRGLPGRAGYSASKFALQGFLEVVRTEHLNDGLHVLTACPGFTGTNIRNQALNEAGDTQGETPLNENQLMSAAEVAHQILKATRKRKRSITLTTQGKLTGFFDKWLPGWMDQMVYDHFQKGPASPLE
jgi:NAD(P)-dependent dehydrogenase (short-subunit alcohol dehydrogenase family)